MACHGSSDDSSIPVFVFLEHSTAFSTSMLSGLSKAQALAKSMAKAAVIVETRISECGAFLVEEILNNCTLYYHSNVALKMELWSQ